MKTQSKLALIAAALPLSLMALAAQAAAIVSVADLDFHKPEDLATFNKRVQAVAHHMCADQINTGTRVAAEGPCIRAVAQEAFQNLDDAHKTDFILAGDRVIPKAVASR